VVLRDCTTRHPSSLCCPRIRVFVLGYNLFQTNGVTAIHVRSDGLNSQIGVIIGAGAVGAGMGPQKTL
jgi:hypothetical protein